MTKKTMDCHSNPYAKSYTHPHGRRLKPRTMKLNAKGKRKKKIDEYIKVAMNATKVK